MGFKNSGNWDNLGDIFAKAASEASEDGLVEKLVEIARERGLSHVGELNLTVEGDPDGILNIDADRVRARANAILAAD